MHCMAHSGLPVRELRQWMCTSQPAPNSTLSATMDFRSHEGACKRTFVSEKVQQSAGLIDRANTVGVALFGRRATLTFPRRSFPLWSLIVPLSEGVMLL